MSKRAFDKIAEGLNEALAFARGELNAEHYWKMLPEQLEARKAIWDAVGATCKSAVEDSSR